MISKKESIVPHIFFERLENRRSTQSLYAGYTPSTSLGRLYYGVSYPDTTPISYPSYPSTGYFPSWGSNYNSFPAYSPYPVYNPYSIWSNQFYQYPSLWMNPFPNFFGGIGSFFSPFRNMFQGFFDWPTSYRQLSPWTPIITPPVYTPQVFEPPSYTNPGGIFSSFGMYAVGIPTGASSAKLF